MFRRRRRPNPIVQALKFVGGVGLGLIVGCLAAALLAPAAGEDTRRRLRELSAGELISNPKGRWQLALEEARKARDAKEQELLADLQTAKRTGSNPS